MILVISTINLLCTETGWNSSSVLMMTKEGLGRSATCLGFAVLTEGLNKRKLQTSLSEYTEKYRSYKEALGE